MTGRMRNIRILFLLFLSTGLLSGQPVSKYIPFTDCGVCRNNLKEVIVLRKFFKEGHDYYFVLDPGTLNTGVLRSDSIIISQLSWEVIRSRYKSTPYFRALEQARMYSDTIQDAGFTRFRSSQKGIDLTIDLCPSQRPLDRIVFTDLIEEMGRVEKPVPIAISVTGSWILNHPGDLHWLDSLVKAGELNVLWINHSYNHYSRKDVPLKMNFMLSPGTDINAEVLNTETALLKRNIIPSIFFRFPGLVSDNNIYKKILDLGLIPVGSDAWLAKGQWPKNGSIVLIHANGNEPLGVREFMILLKNKRAEALSKKWELFDLRKSLIDELIK
jgi:hypothetical protein